MSDSPSRGPETTHWSLIERAGHDRPSVRRPAIDELVRRYLPALRAHLLFRMRLDPTTTDDVVQGFLADRFLSGRLTANADRTRGRFRSLLVRALENYAIDELRRKGREETKVSMAGHLDDHAVVGKPSGDAFDAAWARQVLVLSLREMRRECHAQLSEPRWRLFERRVLQPLLEDAPPPTYEMLVDEFQFDSPQQASNALVSAKRHFQRVLTRVVAEYTADVAETEGELADLRTIVAAAGPIGLRMHLLDTSADGSEPLAMADADEGERLARVFDDHAENSLWGAEDYPGLWQHQLAQPLASVLQAGLLTRSAQAVGRSTTVADLLRHAEPSLEELRQLKEIARTYVKAGHTDIPAEIATALYFTAIAAAISRHGERITKSDDSVLEHGLRALLTRPWLDDETRALLQSVWSQLSI